MTASPTINFAMIPEPLRRLRQWVVYTTKPKPNGKKDKIPHQPRNGHHASTTNPHTWGTFNQAVAAYQRRRGRTWAGIGFVFTKDDPYFGLDGDDVIDDTGEISADMVAILDQLGTYTEITPSGAGVHAIGEGALPPGGRKRGKIELYDCGRFFTMTGAVLDGRTEIRSVNGALTALHRQIFGDVKPEETTPRGGPALSLEDTEVLDRARNGANGGRFIALYGGDWQGQGYESQSAADLAFCNDLRFWCGADPHQMDRIFRESGLYRPKWDEKRGELSYGQRTITLALTGPVYNPGPTVSYVRHEDPLDDEFVLEDHLTDDDGRDACPDAEASRQIIAAQSRRINELADELEELRAVNKGILAVVRSDAKPAAKIAAIELAIEAHTSRPEDFVSFGGIAGRISQSDDSVSEVCKAFRAEVPAAALRAAPNIDDPPFRVAYEARTRNPWTGDTTFDGESNRIQPHIYAKIVPTYAQLSDTLAAIAANIPDELKKKKRAPPTPKAPPAQIPDEQIPPCPDDIDAEHVQHPEIVQVARCDDCGGVLAAITFDGAILSPTTEIIGSGRPDPQSCGHSYLYADKSGRGAEVSQSRREWVQARIERDRIRRHLDQVQLGDGAP